MVAAALVNPVPFSLSTAPEGTKTNSTTLPIRDETDIADPSRIRRGLAPQQAIAIHEAVAKGGIKDDIAQSADLAPYRGKIPEFLLTELLHNYELPGSVRDSLVQVLGVADKKIDEKDPAKALELRKAARTRDLDNFTVIGPDSKKLNLKPLASFDADEMRTVERELAAARLEERIGDVQTLRERHSELMKNGGETYKALEKVLHGGKFGSAITGISGRSTKSWESVTSFIAPDTSAADLYKMLETEYPACQLRTIATVKCPPGQNPTEYADNLIRAVNATSRIEQALSAPAAQASSPTKAQEELNKVAETYHVTPELLNAAAKYRFTGFRSAAEVDSFATLLTAPEKVTQDSPTPASSPAVLRAVEQITRFAAINDTDTEEVKQEKSNPHTRAHQIATAFAAVVTEERNIGLTRQNIISLRDSDALSKEFTRDDVGMAYAAAELAHRAKVGELSGAAKEAALTKIGTQLYLTAIAINLASDEGPNGTVIYDYDKAKAFFFHEKASEHTKVKEELITSLESPVAQQQVRKYFDEVLSTVGERQLISNLVHVIASGAENEAVNNYLGTLRPSKR